MSRTTFYHAGCPVCVSAEQALLKTINPALNVEIVHLGKQPKRLEEAEKAGVKSVPALVSEGNVLHINYGASLEDVRKSIL
ncbi:MAG: thioredoxin family protein [Holosporales bacterium]|jgi:glutaredoxin